ncbi:glutenin, high molecular weight subunit DX5 isoform X2 [Drosophila guanche]|uniref:glutenin, high molecular weight subunit DX5 isoform X2 n=1 Tax=Drosophila guanche TaxID=7266 RepID=UPI001470F8A9|nr:glutenin, high molecular weight subunit DX5 isoform X2 [Drosophila guanche]
MFSKLLSLGVCLGLGLIVLCAQLASARPQNPYYVEGSRSGEGGYGQVTRHHHHGHGNRRGGHGSGPGYGPPPPPPILPGFGGRYPPTHYDPYNQQPGGGGFRGQQPGGHFHGRQPGFQQGQGGFRQPGPGQGGYQQPGQGQGGFQQPGPGQGGFQQPGQGQGGFQQPGQGQGGFQQPGQGQGGFQQPGPGQGGFQQPGQGQGGFQQPGPGQGGFQQPGQGQGGFQQPGPGQGGFQQPGEGGFRQPIAKQPGNSLSGEDQGFQQPRPGQGQGQQPVGGASNPIQPRPGTADEDFSQFNFQTPNTLQPLPGQGQAGQVGSTIQPRPGNGAQPVPGAAPADDAMKDIFNTHDFLSPNLSQGGTGGHRDPKSETEESVPSSVGQRNLFSTDPICTDGTVLMAGRCRKAA